MNLRKIDYLVATEILGWKVINIVENGVIVDKLNDNHPTKFSPTTNLNDAGEIIKKFANDGVILVFINMEVQISLQQ